jgi:hypothetical protein
MRCEVERRLRRPFYLEYCKAVRDCRAGYRAWAGEVWHSRRRRGRRGRGKELG